MSYYDYYSSYDGIYGCQWVQYPSESMLELLFACHPGVVGHILGRDGIYLKELEKDFAARFNGRQISITYDGLNFRVHLSNFQAGITYIMLDFARRVSLANEGIYAQPAGAIIGKNGWWLQRVSESQDTKCTVYHQDGQFFIRFPWFVHANERRKTTDNIRRQIMGRAAYLCKMFHETNSQSTSSTVDYQDIEPEC